MVISGSEIPAASAVREDFIPKDAYVSPEFLKMEADRLWPRVWQIACRLEEIPNEGNFLVYDIADDSIIVVRNADDTVKAFHNACPHRGRRLVNGEGRTKQFVCGFHGWRWNIEGKNTLVVDRTDWGEKLCDHDVRLREVKAETWGGFVWINMDPYAEPLTDFLAPIAELCAPYEFEKLRYRWYKTVIMPCNWKVGIEAFDEAYHVQQTHAQFLEYTEDYSVSRAVGRHGTFWYPQSAEENPIPLKRAKRLGPPKHNDFRRYVLDFVEEFNSELKAMVTPRAYEAAQRLRDEVPADASQLEVIETWVNFTREAAEKEGAGWPELSVDTMDRSNVDWHVFPNTVFLHSSVDGVLWYRSRPNGSDPDSCIFDVWSLVRYAPGDEPPLVREFEANWRDAKWGRILTQDFRNMEQMQRGIKSRGFEGSRTNPVQEQAVSNFHRALYEFLAAADVSTPPPVYDKHAPAPQVFATAEREPEPQS